jgi:valyl-tRNA synthetase
MIDEHIDFSDKWIYSRFYRTLSDLNTAIEKFELNNAAKIIYSFVWSDFCDWYIELAKNRLYSDNEEVKSAVLTRALKLFEDLLKIVHPFMPFITEELWQLIEKRKDGESISISGYPKENSAKINEEAEKEMGFVQDIITALRNIRGEMSIPPSKYIKALLKSSHVEDYQLDYIKKLARVDEIKVDAQLNKPKASASSVLKQCEIYVPLEGLIDLEVEKSRLQKELIRIESALKGIEKKLSNQKFLDNAAPDVVEKEKSKKHDWEISRKAERDL